MELTKKQQIEFLKWFENRYVFKWEKISECSERIIKEGIYWDEKSEYEEREKFFKLLLGKKANEVYKIRAYWPETVLSKVTNSLRLNYSPKITKSIWIRIKNIIKGYIYGKRNK